MNARLKAENEEAEQVTLECICGRTVALNVLEEYDLPTFVGACPCGRVWSLAELSAQVTAGAPEQDPSGSRD